MLSEGVKLRLILYGSLTALASISLIMLLSGHVEGSRPLAWLGVIPSAGAAYSLMRISAIEKKCTSLKP